MFKTIEIETTSICNRKCVYCPNHSYQRPAGYLEERFFYKLIGELEEINFSGILAPHFYGEPLLDKRIVEFIAHAREKLPAVFIELFTNGDFLTYELFIKLIDAGVDVIRVSRHDDETPGHITDLLSAARDRGMSGRLFLIKYETGEVLFNRGGLVEVENPSRMVFCNLRTVTINYEGKVTLCCQDYFSEHTFGDIKKENIVDIWNRREYKSLRDRIKCGDWPLAICRRCNGLQTAGETQNNVKRPAC